LETKPALVGSQSEFKSETSETKLRSKLQSSEFLQPNQPRNIVYKSDDNNRKFLVQWYDEFKWLHWAPDLNDGKGGVLCNICHQGISYDFANTSRKENSFTCAGFTNWKNAVTRFRNHEMTEYHRRTSYKISSRVTSTMSCHN